MDGRSARAWTRVRTNDGAFDVPESWLQDHIAADPEIIMGACREFGFVDDAEEWSLWDTEMPIAGIGSVDVVLVSTDGRVALVEAKLARSPEIRRKVVAQLLDYAIHFREVSLADLKPLPTQNGKPLADPEDVQRHIHEGDYLLVVASDAADERAARLTSAILDRNAIHPWDLALVDLALFATTNAEQVRGDLICVPHVIGGVRCESRHVVEVKVTNTAERAAVVVKLAEPEVVVSDGRTWSRESFRDEFAKQAMSPTFRDLVLGWLAEAEASSGITIRYGKGKRPSVLVGTSKGAFATADPDCLWISGSEYLKGLFGPSLAEERWRQVQSLFPDRPDKRYFQVRARDPRVGRAIDIVRAWART